MLKHKLIAIGGVAIGLSSIVLAHNYQTSVIAKNNSQAKSAMQNEQEKIDSAVKSAVQKQCDLDYTNYSKLPQSISSKISAPTCTVK